MQNPLETMINQAEIPGVSVARISGGGDIATETAGVVNTDTHEAVSDTTVFQAASLSKPVFAYIVLKMVEDGKFSRPGEARESGLDRPLHEICDFGPPELREHPNYKLLTPRNLLSHQAGLPNWFKPNEPESYVAPAKTRFDYSGLGYCFLNEVAEHVAKKPLHELSREAFDKKPLNMSHSSFVPFPEDSAEQTYRAVGHHADGAADTRAPSLPSRANPAASLVTTAEDYAKFLNACLHDGFIRSHMFEPQLNLAGKDKKAMDAKVSEETLRQISWCIGMGLQTADNGEPIAFHWGDNETSRAFTAINLRTNEAVACFTNSANGPSVFQQIAEPVVGSLTPVSQWLSRREGLIFAEDRVNHDAQLTTTPKTTGQYKDKMQEIIKSEPGYMASTESSRAKEREKYSPFQTTPKPPWKP
jgi:CubicO group peptidase (beta-lactamase class C family)